MYTQQRIQRKTRSQSSNTAAETSLFKQRPFTNEDDHDTAQLQDHDETPDAQNQLGKAAHLGHNFGRVKVQDSTPAVIQPKLAIGAPGDKYEQEADSVAAQVMSMNAPASQPSIQRQGTEPEEEEVQMKPLASIITPLVQRQEEAPEEEELQAKPLVQRQEEAPEEEELQAKPLVQRQEEAPEEEELQVKPLVQRQEEAPEEEELQAKPLVQRQEEAPEEEELQAKPLVQRQEAAPEEEEELQAKPLVQRQEAAPEEEELQAKPLVQRQEAAPEEEQLQAKRSPDGNSQTSDNLENQLGATKGSGSPLPDDVRSFMEPRFGADFSQVRVHTDSQAVQMNQAVGAQAFTHGSDIYFGEGKSPGICDLTAHELTHVVQQTGAKSVGSQEAEAHSRSQAQKVHSVSRSVIQRDDTNVETQDQSVVITLLEKNRPAVETARANALARVAKIVKLQTDGNRAIGLLKGRLLNVADGYDQAYNQYAQVIAAAQQEARNQQEITDIIVGIAIGVAVGLAAEGVAACAVVGAVGKVAAKAVGKWGTKAVGEAVGEGVEAAGGKGANGLTEVAGQDLQPDGLKPEVLRMEIWKSLTKLHESLSKMGEGILDQTLLMGSAEYAIGEIKSQKGGGADMTPNEDVDLVLAVLAADKQSQSLDTKLDNASEKISALESGIPKMPKYSVTQMEKDIWILWMSTLQKDCNILDLDAIEDHLKALGIVDFGWYTTDDEENEAIKKAKQQATEVRERRNQAMGAGNAGQ